MPSELKPCPHETVSWNSWTKVNTCDKCFVIVDRPEPATPAGDDALVEELARVLWIAGRNRAGIWDGTESDRWTAYGEGHKPEYRRRALTILPIIARERAAAHTAGEAKGRADERADVAAPWQKFEHWFFKECNVGTRRHLFSHFDLPVEEITNHSIEKIALNRVIRTLLSAQHERLKP